MLVVRRKQPRLGKLSIFLAVILCLSLFNTIILPALAATTVKPSSPDGWAPANVRFNATVAISPAQPRSGDGSLEFTATSGQDKADYEKIWGVTPGRTLGNLSALSYDFYRDSSSTTAAHLAPVLRLYYLNSSGQSGLLIWEPIYNGYGAIATDTWISADILAGNFWMRAFDPGRTIDDYNVSLAQWMANTDDEGSPIDDDADSDAPHVLGPDTYIIGVNVGVGSGWASAFRGNVDNVLVQFGSDEVSANFEPETPCTTVCYVNAASGNDSFGGDTPTSAKKTIQAAIDAVDAGGMVLVAPGSYNESPNITQSLTLQAEEGRDVTTIELQTGPTYLGALTIAGANVTVDGFTITGFDAVGSGLASSNIFVTTAASNVVITNNRLRVGAIGAGSNGDDGMGLITTYSETGDVANLTVAGNIFEPVNLAGSRAFYINPGVNNFTFRQNSITGKFTGTAITQAKNGLVEENIVTGVSPVGSPSAGLGTWGYPDPSVWGQTIFRHNEISAVDNAITINETDNVLVEGNKFNQNGRSVWIRAFGLPFDNSTISINRNSIVGSGSPAMANDAPTAGIVDATLNWWNSATGPTHTSNAGGAGDSVSDGVTFSPWLCDGADTSPAIGFQPNLTPLCAIPTRLVFTTQPGDGIVNDLLSTQPVVRAEDASGNLGFNFSGAVALALEPGGATLNGANPVNAVNGVATFSGLSVDTADTYTLTASALGFTGATSASFAVNAQGNIGEEFNIFLPVIVKNR